jgi:hypothetical protein
LLSQVVVAVALVTAAAVVLVDCLRQLHHSTLVRLTQLLLVLAVRLILVEQTQQLQLLA